MCGLAAAISGAVEPAGRRIHSMLDSALFFGMSRILLLFFYGAAIVFVMLVHCDRRGVKTLTLTALTVMLLNLVVGSLIPVFISRLIPAGAAQFYFGLSSLGASVLSVLAVSLLLAAIFRKDDRQDVQPRFSSFDQASDQNPYVPPSN
ncbi:MAG: hypothetical protein R3C19_25760 [Planctomycetaceae bacterium]